MIEQITTLKSNNGSRVWSVDWYNFINHIKAPKIKFTGISRRGQIHLIMETK